MEITATQRKIDASAIAPEKLAGNSQLTKQEKIAEASRQFEAVLLRQILENSQKTVIKSKYSNESASSAIYRDQVTSQLADSISKAGTFGFAKTFEQQLNRPAETAAKTDSISTTERGVNATSSHEAKTAVKTISNFHERGALKLAQAPALLASQPNRSQLVHYQTSAHNSRGTVHSTFKTP